MISTYIHISGDDRAIVALMLRFWRRNNRRKNATRRSRSNKQKRIANTEIPIISMLYIITIVRDCFWVTTNMLYETFPVIIRAQDSFLDKNDREKCRAIQVKFHKCKFKVYIQSDIMILEVSRRLRYRDNCNV